MIFHELLIWCLAYQTDAISIILMDCLYAQHFWLMSNLYYCLSDMLVQSIYPGNNTSLPYLMEGYKLIMPVDYLKVPKIQVIMSPKCSASVLEFFINFHFH